MLKTIDPLPGPDLLRSLSAMGHGDFAFHERLRQSLAVVATGYTRLYANLILKKGIIRPERRA
jgi:L-fucose mutarotase/ribose pyranase (RbsD/FucU family)